MPGLPSQPARRIAACVAIAVAAAIAGVGAFALRPREPDPLDIGAEALEVLRQADQVEAFALAAPRTFAATAHAPGAVSLAGGFWSRGPGLPLSAASTERARQAVLEPSHYQRHPQPDLCAFDPSWALRFTRGRAFVDVLIDRDCTRATISAAAHGPPGSAGAELAGGGKLTDSGHQAFRAVLAELPLPGPDVARPSPNRRFTATPAALQR